MRALDKAFPFTTDALTHVSLCLSPSLMMSCLLFCQEACCLGVACCMATHSRMKFFFVSVACCLGVCTPEQSFLPQQLGLPTSPGGTGTRLCGRGFVLTMKRLVGIFILRKTQTQTSRSADRFVSATITTYRSCRQSRDHNLQIFPSVPQSRFTELSISAAITTYRSFLRGTDTKSPIFPSSGA